jgi:hypothetical protein
LFAPAFGRRHDLLDQMRPAPVEGHDVRDNFRPPIPDRQRLGGGESLLEQGVWLCGERRPGGTEHPVGQLRRPFADITEHLAQQRTLLLHVSRVAKATGRVAWLIRRLIQPGLATT